MYKVAILVIILSTNAMQKPKTETPYHNGIVPRDVLNYMVPYFLFEKEEEIIECIPSFKPIDEKESLYPKYSIFFKDLSGAYKKIGIYALEQSGLFYYPFPDTKVYLQHKSETYELLFPNAFKASAVACSLFLDVALAWKESHLIKIAFIPFDIVKQQRNSRINAYKFIIREISEKELVGNVVRSLTYDIKAIAFNKKSDVIILKSNVSLPEKKDHFKEEHDFISVPKEYSLDKKRQLIFADYARRMLVHLDYESFYSAQVNKE